MNLRLISVCLLGLITISCTATLNRHRGVGERVRISMRSNVPNYQDAELLAANDSVVYCQDDFGIARENWNRVHSVRVLAYGSQRTFRWLCWVPTLALGIMWFSDADHPNNHGEAAEALAATAFTGVIMYLSAPRSTFRSPPSNRSQEYLRLFARYPQGLTDEQWQQLLRARGQKDFTSRP